MAFIGNFLSGGFKWLYSIDGENYQFNLYEGLHHVVWDTIRDVFLYRKKMKMADLPYVVGFSFVETVLKQASARKSASYVMPFIKGGEDEYFRRTCPFREDENGKWTKKNRGRGVKDIFTNVGDTHHRNRFTKHVREHIKVHKKHHRTIRTKSHWHKVKKRGRRNYLL